MGLAQVPVDTFLPKLACLLNPTQTATQPLLRTDLQTLFSIPFGVSYQLLQIPQLTLLVQLVTGYAPPLLVADYLAGTAAVGAGTVRLSREPMSTLEYHARTLLILTVDKQGKDHSLTEVSSQSKISLSSCPKNSLSAGSSTSDRLPDRRMISQSLNPLVSVSFRTYSWVRRRFSCSNSSGRL